MLGQELVQPGRGTGAVGTHHHPVAVRDDLAQLGQQRLSPAHRGRPAQRRHRGRVGRVGHARHRPRRRVGVGQQALEVHVEPGQVVVVGEAPGAAERGAQVHLLRQHVHGPVPEPPRLHQQDLGVGREQVEQDVLPADATTRGAGWPGVGTDQPRQPGLHALEHLAVGQALPLLAAPGVRGHQALGPLPDLRGGQQLPGREQADPLHLHGGALVGHGELGQPVDLVAPEVDAHRGVRGGGEHVHDGSTHRDLTPVLHLVLAAVAGQHQALHQLVQVHPVPGGHHDGLHVLHVGAQALDQGAGGGHHHPQRRVVGAQAPQHPQPPAHGLDGGADAFERQGLPRRVVLDGLLGEEGQQVRGQALRVGHRGQRHHDGSATGQVRQRGHRHRPGGLRNHQDGGRPSEGPHQAGLLPERGRDGPQRWGAGARGGGRGGVGHRPANLPPPADTLDPAGRPDAGPPAGGRMPARRRAARVWSGAHPARRRLRGRVRGR